MMMLLTGKKSNKKGLSLFELAIGVLGMSLFILALVVIYAGAIRSWEVGVQRQEIYANAWDIFQAMKRDLDAILVDANGSARIEERIGGDGRGGVPPTGYRKDPHARSDNKQIDELYLVGRNYDGTGDTNLAELGWWVYEEFEEPDNPNNNNLAAVHLMRYQVPDDRTSADPDFDYNFDCTAQTVTATLEHSITFIEQITYPKANPNPDTDPNPEPRLRFRFMDRDGNTSDEWYSPMNMGLPELIKVTIAIQGDPDDEKEDPIEFSFLYHLPQSKTTQFTP